MTQPTDRVEAARLAFALEAMKIERDARLHELTDDEERRLIGAALTAALPADGMVGELVEGLELVRNTIGDLRKGFAPSVEPKRWVEQLQAHIDALIAKAGEQS